MLVSLRSYSVRGHRRLLDDNFLQLPPGSCILPGDAIEHLRRDTKYTAISSGGRSYLVRLPITSFERRLDPAVE